MLLLAPPARPRSSRPAATSRSRSCSPRPCSGSRASCGRATSSPAAVRPLRRAARDGARRQLRGDGARARASRTRYVTGTPIRALGGHRRRRGARAARRPDRASGSCSCSAARRPSAGSTTPCSAALPRLVERVRVVHVTGDGGYAAALAAREALPEDLRDRYRPFPFLRDDMTAALAAADLVVGRAGSSTLAEVAAFALPTASCRTRTRPAHQRANARAFADAGAAILVEDEDFDARRAARGRRAPRRPGAPRRRCRPPPASWPGPAPRTPSRSSCSRSPRGEPLPDAGRDRRDRARGAPRDRRRRVTARLGAAPFDAARAPGPTSSAGSASRPSRDEPLARFTTMRVGGPADLFAVVHNAVRAAGARPFARSRAIPLTLLGRGSNVVIADAGHPRPRRSRTGPRARASTATRYHAGGRRPDGPRRDRDPEGRASPGSSSGSRSRARSAARCGRTPAPTARTTAAVLESATSCSPTARRSCCRPPSSASRYRDSRFKDASRCRPAARRDRHGARRSGSSPPTRTRSRPASTTSAAGARSTSRSGIPSAGLACSATRDGDSAGRLIDELGLKGTADRRRGRVREARELHRQRPEGHRRGRPPAGRARPRRRSRDAHGVELVPEIVFVGDWAGWTEEAA